MGAFLTCFRPSQAAKADRPSDDVVRVVHINGYVEDFDVPVTTIQVAGRYPKHVLCSAAHLLTFGASPFRPTERLQPGRLYFLLPYTVFQAESSPVDLATLMNRLTAMAAKKKGGAGGSAPSSAPATPNRAGVAPSSPAGGLTSFINRLGGNRRDFGDPSSPRFPPPSPTSLNGAASPKFEYIPAWQSPARAGMWKPQLDSITEKTLGRSMETESMNNNSMRLYS